MSQKKTTHGTTVAAGDEERALLVQVVLPSTTRAAAAESLAELERLADTAGVKALDKVVQRRRAPDPAYYVGGDKGSWSLTAADILDWRGLCSKLDGQTSKEPPSPSRRIWELLSHEPRQAVHDTAHGARLQKERKSEIVKALNGILKSRDFHRDEDFRAVDVPPKAHELLNHKPNALSDREVQRLNRLLMAAAFPQKIAERHGKLQEIRQLADALGADLVIFDNDLSPANIHNLERELLKQHVIDRTQLVLQIFARRARSAEAETQVELAQLQYTLPRLPRRYAGKREWGGTGMRGPGETRIQRQANVIRRRVRELQKKLDHIESRREVQRVRRHRLPCVTLIGYTNAGKSTLMNALAHEHIYADDRLFATLDTTSRRLRLPGSADVVLSDSVGFIRNMPTHLIASFRSTLDETRDADVLIHVADAAHRCIGYQISVVNETLHDLECADKPVILALNKIDLVDDERRASLREEYPDAIEISALHGRGLGKLVDRVSDFASKRVGQ